MMIDMYLGGSKLNYVQSNSLMITNEEIKIDHFLTKFVEKKIGKSSSKTLHFTCFIQESPSQNNFILVQIFEVVKHSILCFELGINSRKIIKH